MLNRFKKKKTAQKRTKAELDREYADHAIQVGHKMRVIGQMQLEIEAHQKEVESRTNAMIAINEESLKLPPDPAPESIEAQNEVKVS